ncbi:hypothetical protein ACPER7_06360 [Acinetobacter dispersus]|uniref:hypothetical protein n=1 Tax=Acinetobacter dispersus TaxID=70348 RepID=UPI003C302EF4
MTNKIIVVKTATFSTDYPEYVEYLLNGQIIPTKDIEKAKVFESVDKACYEVFMASWSVCEVDGDKRKIVLPTRY